MQYTKFGEEMRVLRARRHQTMQDMADVLGVKKSFLCNVEKGNNAIPKDWIDILCEHYHLKPYPRQILEDAARRSKIHIHIDLKGTSNYKRDLAIVFEDNFDQIDEETAKTVIDILNNSVK